MDKLAKYREIVRKVISEYTTHKPYHGQIDVGAIIDSERDLPNASAERFAREASEAIATKSYK